MNEWHNGKVHYDERFIRMLQDGCLDIFVTKVIKKLMNKNSLYYSINHTQHKKYL